MGSAAARAPLSAAARAPLQAMHLRAATRAPLQAMRLSAAVSPGAPRGVDLNLNDFDLSVVTPAASLGASLPIGSTFWSSIEKHEEQRLFKDIFNPHLSDRRDEGDRFAPPDASSEYLNKLRDLVNDETLLRDERKTHFASTKFAMDDAGALFPSSWTSSFKAACKPQQRSQVRPHTDNNVDSILQSAEPVFDKITEDGMRFRVYLSNGVEVRTTQEHDGKEVIGAVFSVHA